MSKSMAIFETPTNCADCIMHEDRMGYQAVCILSGLDLGNCGVKKIYEHIVHPQCPLQKIEPLVKICKKLKTITYPLDNMNNDYSLNIYPEKYIGKDVDILTKALQGEYISSTPLDYLIHTYYKLKDNKYFVFSIPKSSWDLYEMKLEEYMDNNNIPAQILKIGKRWSDNDDTTLK